MYNIFHCRCPSYLRQLVSFNLLFTSYKLVYLHNWDAWTEFFVCDPSVWNSLPVNLRQTVSTSLFKPVSKNQLFSITNWLSLFIYFALTLQCTLGLVLPLAHRHYNRKLFHCILFYCMWLYSRSWNGHIIRLTLGPCHDDATRCVCVETEKPKTEYFVSSVRVKLGEVAIKIKISYWPA